MPTSNPFDLLGDADGDGEVHAPPAAKADAKKPAPAPAKEKKDGERTPRAGLSVEFVGSLPQWKLHPAGTPLSPNGLLFGIPGRW